MDMHKRAALGFLACMIRVGGKNSTSTRWKGVFGSCSCKKHGYIVLYDDFRLGQLEFQPTSS